jgi:hypothetical protein
MSGRSLTVESVFRDISLITSDVPERNAEAAVGSRDYIERVKTHFRGLGHRLACEVWNAERSVPCSLLVLLYSDRVTCT